MYATIWNLEKQIDKNNFRFVIRGNTKYKKTRDKYDVF